MAGISAIASVARDPAKALSRGLRNVRAQAAELRKPGWSGRRESNPHDQLGRSVTQDEREQGRCMYWSDDCSARELPPPTTDALSLWHVHGTHTAPEAARVIWPSP
jgi:hypothetical protein